MYCTFTTRNRTMNMLIELLHLRLLIVPVDENHKSFKCPVFLIKSDVNCIVRVITDKDCTPTILSFVSRRTARTWLSLDNWW